MEQVRLRIAGNLHDELGSCSPSGFGDISELVDLPSGAAVTFSATGNVDEGAPGTLTNTAIVASPGGVTDAVPGNNSATDQTQLATSVEIFLDGFESGDTSEWGTTVGELAPFLDIESDKYLELTLDLNAEALQRAGRQNVRLLSGQDPHGSPIFEVRLESQQGRYRIVPLIRSQSGTRQRGTATWLDGIPRSLDLIWSRTPGGDTSLLLFSAGTFVGGLERVLGGDSKLDRIQTHLVAGRAMIAIGRFE